jgi:hypothetical protein
MLSSKTNFLALMAFLISTSLLASTPVRKVAPVKNVFSPRGYDSLDSSEIVIRGYLPNACHKVPRVTHSIIGKNIYVRVTSLFYGQPNTLCPEVIYPFVKTIDLGILNKGKYRVFVNKETPYEKRTVFKVREPVFGEDRNQIYANVEYIERNFAENRIVLYGHNPSSCFVLDKVRVVYNNRRTISVLPRMKKISNFCPMKMVPFKIDVKIDGEGIKSDALIHVRSMYGNSVNTIF